MTITPQQRAALIAICDAFIPSLPPPTSTEYPDYWQRKASDLQIVDRVLTALDAISEEERQEFKQLLTLLCLPILGLTWWGPFKSVQQLSLQQREKLLQSWSNSRLGILRKSFTSLKKLTCIFYYGYSEATELPQNPNWSAIQYPGPLTDEKPTFKKQLSPLIISQNKILHCDVVVVGSGAGGSVMASVWSQKGKQVIIVEKGAYVSEAEMNQREVPMFQKAFEKEGMCASTNGHLSILAGSCVGGGTTVNWAGSFRTPDFVLHEWAKEHHNPQFLDPAYKKYFETIEERLSINTNYLQHNPQNQALATGAQKLGYATKATPQNVLHQCPTGQEAQHFKRCGFANLGDAYRLKQCAPTTFLMDAQEQGALILARTEIEKVIIERGKAVGVLGYQTDQEGNKHQVTIRAEKVVIAGGSLHTPAILMRSGLIHPHIGRNLYLHPVIPIAAQYDQPMEAWYGPMMSNVCDEFTHVTDNFGFKIETPPMHSGFLSLAMPWLSAQQHKTDMLGIKHLGVFFPLVRDKFGGRIRLNKAKQPAIDYSLHAYDKKHLIKGLQECAKLHVAAGAKQLHLWHNNLIKYNPSTNKLDDFLQTIAQTKWETNRYILYSAHQMGTCRMGGDAKKHPVKPNGETREVKNLWVADTSIFPHCSGANPMLSIQALAYYIAEQMG